MCSVYYYREDGRDSMKFYTDPDYFLELWCLEIAKDAENQMKRHKQRGRRTAVSMTGLYNCNGDYCWKNCVIFCKYMKLEAFLWKFCEVYFN